MKSLILLIVSSMSLSGIVQADVSTATSHAVSLKQKAQPPHCGLYCSYLLLKVFGQDPNFSDLVQPEYLDTSEGSTLSGLKRIFDDVGLHAEITNRANGRVLRTCQHPMILHVKGRGNSPKYDHYMLYLGNEGGKARVCDPLDSMTLVPFPELITRWDGMALIVSDQPIHLAGLIRGERIRLLLRTGVPVLLLLVLVHVIIRSIPWPAIFRHLSVRVGMSLMQAGCLGAISVIIGLVWHSVSEAGFLAYPEGVASVQQAHITDFMPRINLQEAKTSQKMGAVFIDARRIQDFQVGHVEGAVSVPVDANDILCRDRVEDIPRDASIVVYCQSIRCKYADIVAHKLTLEGFYNIAIFREGWLGWIGQAQPGKPKKYKPGVGWETNEDGTASPTDQ